MEIILVTPDWMSSELEKTLLLKSFKLARNWWTHVVMAKEKVSLNTLAIANEPLTKQQTDSFS